MSVDWKEIVDTIDVFVVFCLMLKEAKCAINEVCVAKDAIRGGEEGGGREAAACQRFLAVKLGAS